MRDFEVVNPTSITIDAASETVEINCAGLGSVGVDVRGTFTATLVPEATIDNINWFTTNANPVAGTAAVTSITAAGAWTINSSGFSKVRLRCSSYTSGTITVKLLASLDSGVTNNIVVTADTELPASVGNLDVNAANTARTTATKVLAVQHLDADGNVLPASPVLGAGSALIGSIGIDQTTPGTTNKVSVGSDVVHGIVDSGTITTVSAVTEITNALPAGTNAIGNVGHGKTIKNYSASITADTDVIAAVASKRIKVIAYSIINQDNTADTIIFKSDGTTGTELWRVYLRGPDANTPFGANLSIAAPSFLFATVAGEKLTADVSSGATLHLSIAYFDDDAT